MFVTITSAVAGGALLWGVLHPKADAPASWSVDVAFRPAANEKGWNPYAYFSRRMQRGKLLVNVRNDGDELGRNLRVRVILPPGIELVPGTTKIYNGSHQGGLDAQSDNLPYGGLGVGSYLPDANMLVVAQVRLTQSPLRPGVIRATAWSEKAMSANDELPVDWWAA